MERICHSSLPVDFSLSTHKFSVGELIRMSKKIAVILLDLKSLDVSNSDIVFLDKITSDVFSSKFRTIFGPI